MSGISAKKRTLRNPAGVNIWSRPGMAAFMNPGRFASTCSSCARCFRTTSHIGMTIKPIRNKPMPQPMIAPRKRASVYRKMVAMSWALLAVALVVGHEDLFERRPLGLEIAYRECGQRLDQAVHFAGHLQQHAASV